MISATHCPAVIRPPNSLPGNSTACLLGSLEWLDRAISPEFGALKPRSRHLSHGGQFPADHSASASVLGFVIETFLDAYWLGLISCTQTTNLALF